MYACFPRGWQPNWYNHFADNLITEGNGLGGLAATFTASGTFYVESFGVPSRVGQHDDGHSDPYNGNLSGPLNIGYVARRNRCMSNSRFTVEGSTECALLEHNRVQASDVGFHVTNMTADVFLVGNECEDVVQPYCWDTPTVWNGTACYGAPHPSEPRVDRFTGVVRTQDG